ncbi:hypothetical protein BU23DRAFT_588670 [Bimuria novae-zelandiae CBS 107.79]|uniref:Single-strand DNA deaminase toxin A-like C-terminal domain-containing protein n=1 Tax=Bimuria novae-zelandiae CBS 107.79 TaxID=1447943 RepID=A0A6A5VPV7_9PLEO|nr:hypothetical protein BU23DRAFT_588670 [Bimuria novae-zelandiae CBS 107.79]
MSGRLAPCPAISVLRWDVSSVYVQCSYCEGEHRHGVRLPGNRVSHCGSSGNYEFKLPIDEHTQLVWYEIDKAEGCFVNVRTNKNSDRPSTRSDTPGQNGLNLMTKSFSTMNITAEGNKSELAQNLYDHAEEMERIVLPIFRDSNQTGDTAEEDEEVFEQRRILSAISACVTGDMNFMKRYLSTSTETGLFLHGRNMAGNTTLILAVMEMCPEIVSLLLEHCAYVNAVNNYGRSALMEAALWGRRENSLQDGDGHHAVGLGQQVTRNEKERFMRSSKAAADKLPDRNADRRYIVHLLDDVSMKKQDGYGESLSESARSHYRFEKSESDKIIRLLGPIHEYPVPYTSKCVGYLDRGPHFVPVVATSGWASDALPPIEENRPSWIDQVFDIASAVGHVLAPSEYDRDFSGQYKACHAEKKLIAYFIDRHVFLPQNRVDDKRLENAISGAAEELHNTRTIIPCLRYIELEKERAALHQSLLDADIILREEYVDDEEDADLDGEALSEVFERNTQRKKIEKINRRKEIIQVNRRMNNLENHSDVARMKEQEKALDVLLNKQKKHRDVIELSENESSVSIKKAVILVSNDVCDDCKGFIDKVNRHLGLSIVVEQR